MTQNNATKNETHDGKLPQEVGCVPCYPSIPPNYAVEEDEIDLVELWAALVKRKWLIWGLTFGLTFLVAIATLFMTPKYDSEVLLAPVSSGSGGGLSALASQYGGLASLAGVSLPSGKSGITEEALAVLQSKKFLGRFIQENHLKPVLFYKNWDNQHHRWKKTTSFLAPIKEGVKSILGVNSTPQKAYPFQEKLEEGEPSLYETIEYFKKNVMNVSEDKKTGMVTLKITWVDPVQARDWANQLVNRINEQLREEAISDAEKTINYLKKQLQTVTLLELKQVLYSLIEEKVKRITLAKVQSEYVFKVIDPAVVADKPSKPKKGLIVVVTFLMGLSFSIFIVLILKWREERKQDNELESK